MSKADKLRGAPVRFFQDSRHAALRRLAPLVEGSLRVPLVADLLEDPVEALSTRNLPGLSHAARWAQSRDTHARRKRIAFHGTPTVSIIVPAYNAASTLRASIHSLLAQTHGALEIIVIDDASSDDTHALALRLAAHDARIRVLRHPTQRGVAAARNTGLAESSGPYLTFQDADDRAHPERIERQLGSLLAAPQASLCICNYRREALDGSPLSVNGRRFAKRHISMLFPRSVFEQVGYFRALTTGEDVEYYERIKAAGGPHAEVHRFETLYYADFDPGSLLFTHGDVQHVGREVTFTESPEERARRESALADLDTIRTGLTSPYVPRDAG